MANATSSKKMRFILNKKVSMQEKKVIKHGAFSIIVGWVVAPKIIDNKVEKVNQKTTQE